MAYHTREMSQRAPGTLNAGKGGEVSEPSASPPFLHRSSYAAHTVYRLKDGTVVPGVTSVLAVLAKPALMSWANRLGLQGIDVEKYVDILAEVGKCTHYLIECQFTGMRPALSSFSTEQVKLAEVAKKKFDRWLAREKPKVLASEIPLVSEQYRYGGTLDLIAEFGGRVEVCDFKTSKDLWPEHVYQLAAYVKLALEAGYDVQGARLVRIGRVPHEGFEERSWEVSDLDKPFEIFKACLTIYELKQSLT